MNKSIRSLLPFLIICIGLTSCSEKGFSRAASTHTLAATSAPTLTQIPTPTPVNARALADTVGLKVDNAPLIQPLADLWSTDVFVSDLAFLPGTDKIILSTGEGYAYGGSDPNLSFSGVERNTKVILWDPLTNSGQDLFAVSSDPDLRFRSLAVSPDGSRIAVVGYDQIVLAKASGTTTTGLADFIPQSLPAGEIAYSNDDHGAAFSPDGKLLVEVNAEGDVQVWDADSGQVVRTFINGTKDSGMGFTVPVCDMNPSGTAFTVDNRSVLSICNDDIQINDLSTGKSTSVMSQLGFGYQVFSLAPDGKSVAIGLNNGTITIRAFPSGEKQFELTRQPQGIINLAFSPDGSLLASASADGTTDIWNTHTRKLLTTLDAAAYLMAFSPDGRFLLTATHTLGAKLWGVYASSSTTAMNGVKLVLSEGTIKLEDWKGQVPQSWLAPAGTLPRYQIQINSTEANIESCSYNGSNLTNAMVSRQRLDVTVKVVDMQKGETVAQTVFQGGMPGECPQTWSFSPNSIIDYIYGSNPDPSQFSPWLKQVMGPLGYRK